MCQFPNELDSRTHIRAVILLLLAEGIQIVERVDAFVIAATKQLVTSSFYIRHFFPFR